MLPVKHHDRFSTYRYRVEVSDLTHRRPTLRFSVKGGADRGADLGPRLAPSSAHPVPRHKAGTGRRSAILAGSLRAEWFDRGMAKPSEPGLVAILTPGRRRCELSRAQMRVGKAARVREITPELERVAA